MTATCADIERGWNGIVASLRDKFGAGLAAKLERTVLQMLATEQHYMARMDMTPTECQALHAALAECNHMLAEINARDVKPPFSHA